MSFKSEIFSELAHCLPRLALPFLLVWCFKSYAGVEGRCEVLGNLNLRSCDIYISGHISQKNIQQFNSEINKIREGKLPILQTSYYLDSLGGDVYAALSLGRLIRKDGGKTVVHRDAKCASACIFLLAAGKEKWPIGEVIIHRPFLNNVGVLTDDFIQQSHERVKSDVEIYLKEMNVPISLYQKMYSVPPENGYILSREELQDYVLTGIDPIENEKRMAQRAGRLGLSRQRLLELENYCDQFFDEGEFLRGKLQEKWNDCVLKVQNGTLK